jgi:acyl-coenzyme A synthetase/AMP-(fatty) acid ligase/acyl carrier protein
VASLIAALEQSKMYAVTPRTVAWNASVSFDASVQQWARVCRGDTIVILDENHRKDPALLAAWLDECAVSDLDMTPSHWELLRDDLLAGATKDSPRRLFIGGEPISENAWQEIESACAEGKIEALNLYGPTECTVDAAATWIEGPGPHIGGPLAGNLAYVLDDKMRPAPVGVAGELYIGGPQVADGYLHRPGLTAQRFLADPYGVPGARIYRTGDEVRWSENGTIEFLGRADRQVKLRGYRVELGEIESVMRVHPAVASAATVIRSDGPGGERLVAYYVLASGASVTAGALREHMSEALPDFMVPTGFLAIDALPLTANGKLDTEALPAPEALTSAEDWTGTEPSGQFEQVIAEVWSQVLGLERVSADDDFFALGGHSLIALRVIARLKKDFSLAISTKEVYRHPRLSDLARYVESLSTADAGATVG